MGAVMSRPLGRDFGRLVNRATRVACRPELGLSRGLLLFLFDAGATEPVLESVLDALRAGDTLRRTTRYVTNALPSLSAASFGDMRQEAACSSSAPCYLMCKNELKLISALGAVETHENCNAFLLAFTQGLTKVSGATHLLAEPFLHALHLLAPHGYFLARRDESTNQLSVCARDADYGTKKAVKVRYSYSEFSSAGQYDKGGE